jgi:hypothetical protein
MRILHNLLWVYKDALLLLNARLTASSLYFDLEDHHWIIVGFSVFLSESLNDYQSMNLSALSLIIGYLLVLIFMNS